MCVNRQTRINYYYINYILIIDVVRIEYDIISYSFMLLLHNPNRYIGIPKRLF